MHFLLLPMLAATLWLSACSSSKKNEPSAASPATVTSDSEYEAIIDRFTRMAQKYKGFYNLYEVHVTLQNSLVRSAMLQRLSEYQQWDPETLRQSREKMFQEMSTESSVTLSFFSPDKGHNDLDKGNSIWKVYLENQGKRYVGKIKKDKNKYVQLQTLFPHHTRFSTAYEVIFPVPMTSIENHPTSIVLSSSVGTSRFEFPAIP